MTGRRVLITGAGSGIGRAVARAVVAAGGRVVAVGRNPRPLTELAGELAGAAVPLTADVADESQRAGLVNRAAGLLGGLDGLVHAAGVIRREPYGAISESALREQIEVHFVASLRLGEQALEVLAPGGAVVLVASNLALRPIAEAPVYSACKAAMVSIAQSLALAGGPRRIRASVVLPGIVDTAMQPSDRLDRLAALHPLGRAGTAEDVAGAVLHLLSAPWTTGAALVVDGGFSLRE